MRLRSPLRMVLDRFQRAEDEESYAKWGYLCALGPFVLVGLLLSILLPRAALTHRLASAAAEFLRIPQALILEDSAPLALLVLLWFIGLLKRSIWVPVGRLHADLFIKGADWFGALGEWLAAHRLSSLLLSVSFGLLGLLFWSEHRELTLLRVHDEAIVRRWLSSTLVIADTATLSVRDTPSFERTSPELSLEEFDGLLSNLGRVWLPTQCLGQFIKGTYERRPSDTDSVLREGVLWRQRLTDIVSAHSEGPCAALLEPDYEASDKGNADALSLYRTLLAKSYIRLAGQDCSDHGSLVSAYNLLQLASPPASFAATSDDNHSLDYSMKRSALGNVYACMTRLYAYDKTPPELARICKSSKDCYQRAVAAYNESAIDYARCSFHRQRAVNNTADLHIKLAISQWQSEPKATSRFLADESLVAFLTQNSEDLITCIQHDQTPTEVFVTIAQVFGTLSHSPDATVTDSVDAFLGKSGWYLSVVLLKAESDIDWWEMGYFCKAWDRDAQRLRPSFVQSVALASVPEATTRELARRISAECQ